MYAPAKEGAGETGKQKNLFLPSFSNSFPLFFCEMKAKNEDFRVSFCAYNQAQTYSI